MECIENAKAQAFLERPDVVRLGKNVLPPGLSVKTEWVGGLHIYLSPEGEVMAEVAGYENGEYEPTFVFLDSTEEYKEWIVGFLRYRQIQLQEELTSIDSFFRRKEEERK